MEICKISTPPNLFFYLSTSELSRTHRERGLKEEIRERINKGKEDKEQKRRETRKKLKARNMVYPVMTDAASFGDDDASSSARSDDQHVTITIKELASINPSILRSIPVVDFNTQGFKDGIQCVVCLSELADGDKATVFPTCNHWFHAHCIDSWFQSHSTCPVCRNIVGLAKNHYSGFEPDESLTNSLPTTNTAVIEDSDETNEVQPDQICSRLTTKIIFGVALPRRCPSAMARLATDRKLCASEIYGVADNVNGTAARFVNSSFNRLNLFGLRGGYIMRKYNSDIRLLHTSWTLHRMSCIVSANCCRKGVCKLTGLQPAAYYSSTGISLNTFYLLFHRFIRCRLSRHN
ncbi:hypothetical protein YC2023_062337 [Brassica napus]